MWRRRRLCLTVRDDGGSLRATLLAAPAFGTEQHHIDDSRWYLPCLSGHVHRESIRVLIFDERACPRTFQHSCVKAENATNDDLYFPFWWLFLGYQTGCTSRTRGNGATFSPSQRGPAQLRRAIRAHGATWYRRASQTVGCAARGSTVCAFGASRHEWTSRLERNLQRLWVLGQQR